MERKQSPTFLISSLPLKNLFRTFKDPLTWIHPALRHTIFVFQPASSCTPQSSAPAAPPIAVAFSQGFSDLVSCFGFCLLPPELSLITLARSTFLYWFTGWPGVLRFMGSQRVVSDSLWPYGLWHSRLPCPSPNSQRLLKLMSTESLMPSNHLIFCRPPTSQHQGLFQWVSSSHQVAKVLGVSASASVLPMNAQDWSPLGWTGWISLQSKGLSRVFSNTTVQKHQFFALSLLYSPTLTSIHDHWKNHLVKVWKNWWHHLTTWCGL